MWFRSPPALSPLNRAQTILSSSAHSSPVSMNRTCDRHTPIRSLQDTLGLWDDEAEDMRLSGISTQLDDYSVADRIKERSAEVDRRMFLDQDHSDKIPLRSPSFETWEDKRANLIQAVEIEKRIISV